MTKTETRHVKRLIRKHFGCEARLLCNWRETVDIDESVGEFRLTGHPAARRAYARSMPGRSSTGRRIVIRVRPV